MTLPRRVLPGQVHFVTRRCSERRFFLRPGPEVNEVVRYALARAAAVSGVEVLLAICLSTHLHLALHDPDGKLPEFMRELDCLIARALNAWYGRGEDFWGSGSYSNVEIHDAETLLDKLVYLLLNPVQDGLVPDPRDWPGLVVLPEQVGTTLVCNRPETAFFGGRRPADHEPGYGPARKRHQRQRRHDRRAEARLRRLGRRAAPTSDERRRRRNKPSTLPEQYTLRIAVPPGFEHLGVAGFRKLLRERLDARHVEILDLRRMAGYDRFLGVEAVRGQDPMASAGDTFPAFALDPRIAALDHAVRVPLLRALKQWREEYQAALALWREGGRRRARAVFPYGTYLRRVFDLVRVAEPPPSIAPPLRWAG